MGGALAGPGRVRVRPRRHVRRGGRVDLADALNVDSRAVCMDVDAYLERIGYRGPPAPTAETLRRLHVAHLLAVPFENLSIHAGEPVVLDDESLFDKVVARRRGGFCYELNGLFAALLRALGFEVEMLSAAVRGSAGKFGPEFDHMTLLVKLGERWLADVGFGDSFV